MAAVGAAAVVDDDGASVRVSVTGDDGEPASRPQSGASSVAPAPGPTATRRGGDEDDDTIGADVTSDAGGSDDGGEDNDLERSSSSRLDSARSNGAAPRSSRLSRPNSSKPITPKPVAKDYGDLRLWWLGQSVQVALGVNEERWQEFLSDVYDGIEHDEELGIYHDTEVTNESVLVDVLDNVRPETCILYYTADVEVEVQVTPPPLSPESSSSSSASSLGRGATPRSPAGSNATQGDGGGEGEGEDAGDSGTDNNNNNTNSLEGTNPDGGSTARSDLAAETLSDGGGEGGDSEHANEGEDGSSNHASPVPSPVGYVPPPLRRPPSPVYRKEIHRHVYMCLDAMPEDVNHKRSMYFLKNVDRPVSTPNSPEDADYVMASAFEQGIINAESLTMLEVVLRDVYMPLLRNDSRVKRNESVIASSAADLLANMNKFAQHIQHTVAQVKSKISIKLPPGVVLGPDPRAFVDDPILLQKLEEAGDVWTKAIVDLFREEDAKSLEAGEGPMAEIDYWRSRSAHISTVYEQFQRVPIQQALAVLELAESHNFPPLQRQIKVELTKKHTTAHDNVRFLQILERHFKILESAPMEIVAETITPMIQAIRMVWVISRFYRKDHNLERLLERIARQIATRVKKEVSINALFNSNLTPEEAMDRVTAAKEVLDTWERAYLKAREKIEQSESEKRWEFDKRRLFEHTNFLSARCDQLREIARVLNEFRHTLGPELKAVTGDPARIEEVIRAVDQLRLNIVNASCDPFDKRYIVSWTGVYNTFNKRVEDIDVQAQDFIEESFNKLRSARGTFAFLESLQPDKCRPTIRNHVERMNEQIINQFSREIDNIATIFTQHKANPPVARNMPPVAGAIAWCHALFLRMKESILMFQNSRDMRRRPLYEDVKQKYMAVGLEMRDYEDRLHKAWFASANDVADEYLTKPILKAKTDERRFPKGVVDYEVHFHPALTQLIHETKYLDGLGRAIPDLARNVALQEDEYHDHVEALEDVLESYRGVLDLLSPAEIELIAPRDIADVQAVLEPGLTSLNWKSLGIREFIDTLSKAVTQFQHVGSQLQRSASHLDEHVRAIGRMRLVAPPPPLGGEDDVLELRAFKEYMESARMAAVEAGVVHYRQISSTLVIIGNQLDSSGATDFMAAYYRHWEAKVYAALLKATLAGLSAWHDALNVRVNRKARRSRCVPLFKVIALRSPRFVTSPAFSDIVSTLGGLVDGVVSSAGAFVRWKRYSCVECPPGRPRDAGADVEPTVFTFKLDIERETRVVSAQKKLHEFVDRTRGYVDKYLSSWNFYKNIWKVSKDKTLDKLQKRNPPCVSLDKLLSIYQGYIDDLHGRNRVKDVEFLRINLTPLIESLKDISRGWKVDIADLLAKSSRTKLHEVDEQIATYAKNISKPPDEGIAALKFVLKAIATIRDASMDMEFAILDIEERYRTLTNPNYNLPPPPEEDVALVAELPARWAALVDQAKAVDESLDSVKLTFTKDTQDDVDEFKASVAALLDDFNTNGPGSVGRDLDRGLELIKHYTELLQAKKEERDTLVLAEKLFDLEVTSFPELVEIEDGLANLGQIYDLYSTINAAIEDWSSTRWSDLDVVMLEDGIKGFQSKLKRLPKALHKLEPFAVVKEKIQGFKESIPLFSDLKNEALRDRHWAKLMEVTGKVFNLDPKTFTLQNMFDMELHNYKEIINEITSGATKELAIEKGINEVAECWKSLRFEMQKYTPRSEDRGYILSGIKDIQEVLDENSMALAGMAASPYVEHHATAVNQWLKDLSHIAEVTELWMSVQRKWMYLEVIFVGSKDIKIQLREQADEFAEIDTLWARLMTETHKNTLVLEACKGPAKLARLQSLASDLERCQKSLSEYLETKRNNFARFFFISDDELLSVLGTQDPEAIQPHMIKLFANTATLIFGTGRQANVVHALESSERERLPLVNPVPATGNVEHWMSAVEAEMQSTLRSLIKEAVFYYPKTTRSKWVDEYKGMVVLTASQVWWTWEVEDVFQQVRKGNKLAMKQFSAKLNRQLGDLVATVRSPLNEETRKKVNTLIIIDVHARDVIESFVRDSILDAREFEWESQLRFYWDRLKDTILIRQCNGVFDYGYEYQGLNGRLVITPLTDRCIMTLTQALSMRLGGSPAGPAGTGKTETVKDLAKAMGINCLVFNCGEGLDYQAMGSNFSGLVQTGSWGCFDEFNRIEPAVLSVVSSQISKIQAAMIAGKTHFDFEGRDKIKLDMKAGIFITMNPGYEGRAELPDNLKALFRPVVMIVPDLELICEIMLFSEGFVEAKVLATKMTVLYKLAKEQLSKQDHYDFGLRAMKSVLVTAGRFKRAADAGSEEEVLMRALRDMNMPKFVFEDVPLFRGLVGDLFPDLTVDESMNEKLSAAIIAALESGGYQIIKDQVQKVKQLAETMGTRHTTMVVGPTCGGKTVVINALKDAQKSLGIETKLYILNPKAVAPDELYGWLNEDTRDWTNGVLSTIYRNINERELDTEEAHYIVFDGDVDAVWVENMNSVMDDNRILTLPNGERIGLKSHCKLLFEVSDLQHASPATISRCGMVYLDPRNLGYRPYFLKWAAGLANSEQATVLRSLFDKYVPQLIGYIFHGVLDEHTHEALETIIPLSPLAMVKQVCNIVDSIITPDKSYTDVLVIEAVFIYALVWGLGGGLVEDSRLKLDAYIKKLSELILLESPGVIAGVGQLPIALPTLFDYTFDDVEEKWFSWQSRVAEYAAPAGGVSSDFHHILVPTVDTVRSTALLHMFTSVGRPVLFVGESGTAKTVTINSFLRGLPTDTHSFLGVNFSSRTTSMALQHTLLAAFDKWTQHAYGPKGGKELVVFIDDLNMPRVDKYGTQQPIALLKLCLQYGGLYLRNYEKPDLSWIQLKDVQFVSSMAPPSGGRSAVDPRFISLFNVINITFPSDDSLKRIYHSILTAHLNPFSEAVAAVAEPLTDMTLKLYRYIVQQLPPTPSKFHYIFNLRDLSRVYHGLVQSTVDHFDDVPALLRLWRNECLRVFHDRLILDADKSLVQAKIEELLLDGYPEATETAMAEPLVFGDFGLVSHIGAADGPGAAAEAALEPRLYNDLGDYDAIRAQMIEILADYNDVSDRPMNLVLFDDALEHLVRIHRMLRMPRTNALLVGVDGSGRQSLTRLAAFLAGCDVFEIALTGNYGEDEFRGDLKRLYNDLAASDRPIVFLFTDAHVAQEGFLELINNMLTIGIVPALFTDEEMVPLRESVAKAASQRGIQGRDNVWSFYVETARNKLHIVLSMSPEGDTLRRRCRSFPGLVNDTVIDWFTQWPEEALFAVAAHFVEDVIPEEFVDACVSHMVEVHRSVLDYSIEFEAKLRRKNYCTPKNFLDFIQNYTRLLVERRDSVARQCKRLEGGLSRLVDAGDALDALNDKLQSQRVVLEESARTCKEFLDLIDRNNDKVTAKKKAVTQKKFELNAAQEGIERDMAEAEEALQEAMPLLADAQTAVDDLNMRDVTELRGLAHPPINVQQVACAVLALLGKGLSLPKDLTYPNARSLMAQADFKSQLKGLIDNVDSISTKQINAVKDIIRKRQLFDPSVMEKTSLAGMSMLRWVLAIVHYSDIAKVVNPRKKAVARAQQQLEKSKADLAEIQAESRALTDELEKLEAQLYQANSEKVKLRKSAEVMERRLIAAEKLMSGLESEQRRWTDDLEKLNVQFERLVGDCMLSAAFLSYTGAFNFEFRQKMVNETWQDDLISRAVPLTLPFSLAEQLTDAVEVSNWASEGLPSDDLSVQNGILTTRSSRWPLCVDPQMQAVSWIRARESDHSLKTSTFADPNFIKHLTVAVQYGEPFLFEGVDGFVDPIIDPLLEAKGAAAAGGSGSATIVLADKEIEVHPDFRLYLTTRVANPSYSPAVFAKTMIINYTVTQQGLEDQLLNAVVRHEREELEIKRETLIKEMAESETKLKGLEDQLLRELEGADSNMLDNEDLINALQEAKQQASDLKSNLEEARLTSADVERSRSQYRPVAKRGSILFFVLSSLSSINSMYEFSLQSYMGVFTGSLVKAAFDAQLAKRLKSIVETLTLRVYNYGCTGLFEKHRLMYSFQITIKTLAAEGAIDPLELDFFLKGNIALEKTAAQKPFAWVSDQGWEDLQRLITIGPLFANVVADLTANETAWFEWYDHESPEELPLPLDYSDKLSEFQAMLLLKCFRADRVFPAVANFVMHHMGPEFVAPPAVNIRSVYEQTMGASPVVVFILSPGADPFTDLKELAEEETFTSRFKPLSLGQGQSEKAEQMLKLGMERGHWVLLMNCHLLTDWLRVLQGILERGIPNAHEKFRCWLTTEPEDKFPVGILQMALKVVTEPPNGLKFNMLASYDKLSDEVLDHCQHAAFKPLVYVLSFFHAVVQERRKYGKIGWNVPYDFNESDFRVSLELLDIYLTKAATNGDTAIPWNSLRYLIGEAMYGGRVTDSYDRRVLITYLREYMGDFLFDTFQPFHFFVSDEANFSIPPADGGKAGYMAAINDLPTFSSPEVFGLHPNAEIDYLTNASRALWRGMIAVQPRTAAAGGAASRETVIGNLARDIQARLPSLFDVKRIRNDMDGVVSPVSVVLLQELDMFNNLLRKMITTLHDLQKALVGEIGMSVELDELSNSLFNGMLPAVWRRLAPPTQKTLANWMDHFLRRHQQFDRWVKNGEPVVMWLSGLHVPGAYLTALVQTTCRANGWALDRSTLYTTVTKYTSAADVPERPESGCYVEGLYLEGASWDVEGQCLVRQDPKVLVTELPVLRIVPIETHLLKLQGTFETPVYVTQERRNAMGEGLVFHADLATSEHQSFWVLQGVALCLNTV